MMLFLFLFSFFLCVNSNRFMGLDNSSLSWSGGAVWYAVVDSSTGAITTEDLILKGTYGSIGQTSYINGSYQIFAVSFLNFGTSPETLPSVSQTNVPQMYYGFLDQYDIPSPIDIVSFPADHRIWRHAFQPSTGDSIVLLANSTGIGSTNAFSVWSVDMNWMTPSQIFDITLENISFFYWVSMAIDDSDRVFIIAIAENGTSGVISYDLNTGDYLGMVFGYDFINCLSLGVSGETLYCLTLSTLAAVDIKTGQSHIIAQDWCSGTYSAYDENSGFDWSQQEAYIIINDCNGVATWFTIHIGSGTVTSTQSDHFLNIYGPRPLD